MTGAAVDPVDLAARHARSVTDLLRIPAELLLQLDAQTRLHILTRPGMVGELPAQFAADHLRDLLADLAEPHARVLATSPHREVLLALTQVTHSPPLTVALLSRASDLDELGQLHHVVETAITQLRTTLASNDPAHAAATAQLTQALTSALGPQSRVSTTRMLELDLPTICDELFETLRGVPETSASTKRVRDTLTALIRRLRTFDPDAADETLARLNDAVLTRRAAHPALPRAWRRALLDAHTEIRSGVELDSYAGHDFLYDNRTHLTDPTAAQTLADLRALITAHPDTCARLPRGPWLRELVASPHPADDTWATMTPDAIAAQLDAGARQLPAAARAAIRRRDVPTELAARVAGALNPHETFFSDRGWDHEFVIHQLSGAPGWFARLAGADLGLLDDDLVAILTAAMQKAHEAENRLPGRAQTMIAAIDESFPHLSTRVALALPWSLLPQWMSEPHAGPELTARLLDALADPATGDTFARVGKLAGLSRQRCGDVLTLASNIDVR